MAISDKLKKTAEIKIDEKRFKDIPPSKPKTGPAVWQAAHQKAAIAQEELDKALARIAVLEKRTISIDELHEVKGLKRNLTTDAYEELKTNLANNPLIHPIVVRPREKGGYEIVSGHNRVAIYKELGKTEIEADIKEVSEEELYETAFYANLFHSPMSDYDKYVRFNKIKEDKGYSVNELADKAGVSSVQIYKILEFSKFPEKCHKIFESNPHCVSYTNIGKLLSAEEGALLDIVNKLATGEINQVQAVTLATKKEKPLKEQPKVTTLKVGKKKFAEIKARKGVVSVHLIDETYSEEIIRRVEAAVRDVIGTIQG